MDGDEHAAYRAVVDRCFTPQRVAAFVPQLRRIAGPLVTHAADLVGAQGTVEVMAALAEPYAALAQCAYLGWPPAVAQALRQWSAAFDAIIVAELDRARADTGPRTLTHDLLAEQVGGRPLADADLVSIVRNWTAGELGTIAAAVGIVVAHLARDPRLQDLLRAQPQLRQAAMDEMLRIEPPLISNRRRTTRAVSVAGRTIPAHSRVTVLWPAAQRDPAAFEEPTGFRLDRDPDNNLLYGRGPHACPGEGLSRAELGVLLQVLLAQLPAFRMAEPPAPARPPAGGFAEVRIAWGPSPW
jgi:cytochrome P450